MTTQNLTTQLLKSMAYKQFNGEGCFILYSDLDNDQDAAFEGDYDEARLAFQESIEGTEEADIELNFLTWCEQNLTQIEPLADDNEIDNYLILTDAEADERAADYIKDSLWAFNASFIIEHSDLPYEAEEMIKTFQADKCEGANDTVEALINDMDEFIKDAIAADGRGHFMSSYDGKENEETVENETFYIYRNN